MTDILLQIVTDAMRDNEDLLYDELLEVVKVEIEKVLSDKSVERIISEIIMLIENIEGNMYEVPIVSNKYLEGKIEMFY